MIVIIDYGMGNLYSIQNMLRKCGEKDSVISSDVELITKADGVILPGVGAFDMGMRALKERNIDDCIKEIAKRGTPILGICLGMQLLGKRSEEGSENGLGILDFECVKFRFDECELKVPHMGWDYVHIENVCPLSSNMSEEQRFYFVHSYKAICSDPKDVFMSCKYGELFAAAVNRENVYGVQFHPEKSHKYGMKLLQNFVEECKRV